MASEYQEPHSVVSQTQESALRTAATDRKPRNRALSSEEIAKLTSQGCSCGDWLKVEVAESFDPARVKSTHFQVP